MRSVGVALLVGVFLVAAAGLAASHGARSETEARAITDGRLRPGHLETIRLAGFPGRGKAEVSFFPFAICEDECGAESFPVGRTDANGAGRFRVRVPGTFIDKRKRHVFFRDGERVDVEVTWEGAGHSFVAGSAWPEPRIVRFHGTHASAARAAPLPVPGAFQLQGTNGYTLYVIGAPPRKGSLGSLLIFAVAEGERVVYQAPAKVTGTSIQANLGALGEISVEFRRTGRATRVPCGKQTVRFASGSYEGRIVSQGEEGYTSAEATTVPADGALQLSGICEVGVFGGSSGPREGAQLNVRNPGLGPSLSVVSARRGAAAFIVARLSEYENGIGIERTTERRIRGRDFTYGPHLRTASVHPPLPFSGSAQFDRGLKAGRRWSGDLAVEMPGRADVPLTGPLLRATLSPYGQ